ncbi:hypothetical protein R0K05_20155, partial [Planococcus sp. SIMBA_160]
MNALFSLSNGLRLAGLATLLLVAVTAWDVATNGVNVVTIGLHIAALGATAFSFLTQRRVKAAITQ